jgi:hypothetical protein
MKELEWHDSQMYTTWYPRETRPVRVGVYQRYHNGVILYSYWSGVYWGSGGDTISVALEFKKWRAITQDTQWRGVPF